MDPSKITSLLKKYDVAGPRYTSYPTVPAWSNEVTILDYQKSLGQLKEEDHLSLYFHLPFCENLCHFCGCMQVITKDHSRSKEYVEILLKEIKKVVNAMGSHKRKVTQIHFGGGTPNFLQPEELTEIMDEIHQHFLVEDKAEIAIEMHPRTSTKEFCENLKKLNFNRISLGVQDFDPTVQKLINRHQSYEITLKMLNDLRELGFDSFNFDLVYGLPGQTMTGWKNTLEKVVELQPNRLAVYSYAHVPWLRPVQRTFKDEDLPTPKMKLEFFSQALDYFLKADYQLIGMDHFALKDDELSKALNNGSLHRNFMGYSTKKDTHQIGFGVSSISYVANNYFQNKKKLKEYQESILHHELATFKGMILNQDDLLRRDLITQIMCNGMVDWKKFDKKWKIDHQDYFPFMKEKLSDLVIDHLLELTDEKLIVKKEGFLFLRNISMVFDKYLEEIRINSNNPTFSRTV